MSDTGTPLKPPPVCCVLFRLDTFSFVPGLPLFSFTLLSKVLAWASPAERLIMAPLSERPWDSTEDIVSKLRGMARGLGESNVKIAEKQREKKAVFVV